MSCRLLPFLEPLFFSRHFSLAVTFLELPLACLSHSANVDEKWLHLVNQNQYIYVYACIHRMHLFIPTRLPIRMCICQRFSKRSPSAHKGRFLTYIERILFTFFQSTKYCGIDAFFLFTWPGDISRNVVHEKEISPI
ncbi:hypothetical protein POVWA2_004470 [Plasmodium ovale wallikeri]|uniref:Uncharacterized protein n=1 Tax=Plasmodium ovale wallikeri TaxID=864142 RepID=A0A1A8YJH8_PLAOA|nr:hypothetical protein POVWA1_004340 [Plasmodium ovale wallikeri]SBT31495.1 hypothetical protein POVWA2_004470 [Plasmodium ovale wallikeri]